MSEVTPIFRGGLVKLTIALNVWNNYEDLLNATTHGSSFIKRLESYRHIKVKPMRDLGFILPN